MAQRNDAGTSSLTVDAREAPSQNSGHFVALTCGVLLHLTLSITFSLDIFGCNKKKKFGSIATVKYTNNVLLLRGSSSPSHIGLVNVHSESGQTLAGRGW